MVSQVYIIQHLVNLSSSLNAFWFFKQTMFYCPSGTAPDKSISGQNSIAIATDDFNKEYEMVLSWTSRYWPFLQNTSVKMTQLEQYLYILELFFWP